MIIDVPSIFYKILNFEFVKGLLLSYKTILLFLFLTQVFYARGQDKVIVVIDGIPALPTAETDSLFRNIGPDKKDTLLFCEKMLIAYNLESKDIQSCVWMKPSIHSIGCYPASSILYFQTKKIKQFYLNGKLKRRRKGIPVSYFKYYQDLLPEAVRKNWRIGQEKLEQIEIIIPD